MLTVFGPFHLVQLLGRGGMAECFVSYRRSDPEKKLIVLKRIRPDLASRSEYLKRFILEAQVASRLIHPNLVRFLEFGCVGACHYITMERVHGYSLHRLLGPLIQAGKPPPLEVALIITACILDGLAAMHEIQDEEGRPRPMLHRDVTPSNIILTPAGRPVVIDFGIAKDVLGPNLTVPGQVIGTARYMAPEHRKAEFIDARADVFSASVIAFELITARHPWRPLPVLKELLRFTFDSPEMPDHVRALIPPDIEAVVLRGLECDSGQRWANALAMKDALTSSETYRTICQNGEEAVGRWLASLGLPTDEELDSPVLDFKSAEGSESLDLIWSPQGELASRTQGLRDVGLHSADLPAAEVLPVPPLPPTRESALGHAASHLETPHRASVPVWVLACAAMVAAILVGFLLRVGL